MSARRDFVRASAKRALGVVVRRAVRPRRDLSLETFGLSRQGDGLLALRGVELASLANRFGSPLFVVDATTLDRNADEFAKTPGVECFYSYKTNPVPAVLERLHARGVGAEVVSEYELWLARRLGVPGERIVSNGPGRTREAIRAAVEVGALVHANHREEIATIAEVARSLGKCVRVGLRVVTTSGWTGQFGEPIEGGSALAACREMMTHPELSLVSLHTHVGVGLHDAEAVERLASELVGFAATVRRELGVAVEILDFGGSLASPTVSHFDPVALRLNRTFSADLAAADPATTLSIRDYVDALARAVEARCREHDLRRPRIFVEPGRALTSAAQMLVCRVTAVKASGARGITHAILDAGVNIAEPVRNEYHQIFVDGPPRPEERHRLVGPICTPMDTLAWSIRLPRLSPGDLLAIMDAGAYFVPFSTSFSFPQPAIAIVDHGEAHLARRRETFEDLVRRDELG
jgi:diaminopimelate decarboxylase